MTFLKHNSLLLSIFFCLLWNVNTLQVMASGSPSIDDQNDKTISLNAALEIPDSFIIRNPYLSSYTLPNIPISEELLQEAVTYLVREELEKQGGFFFSDDLFMMALININDQLQQDLRKNISILLKNRAIEKFLYALSQRVLDLTK